MNSNLIFFPVLLQIALTIAVFIVLNVVKVKASKLGHVDEKRRSLSKDAWPDYVQKVSNNISNQFETPVLFYALCFILWAVKSVDVYALILAWGYLITRVIHAYIQTGSNYVPHRRRVFTLGCVFLAMLTILCFKALVLGNSA